MMRKSSGIHIPTPPPFHNKGNWIFSLSQLGRYLAEQAEELGAMLLPETDAQTLLVVRRRRARREDRRQGPRPRPRARVELRAWRRDPRARHRARGGHAGPPLAGARPSTSGLPRTNPQIYSLGVKEVWKVKQPLDRVVHTLGWPLRPSAKYGESGGSFIYPMGDDMVAIGFVVGLDYHDSSLSPHDLLQQFKTHKLIRPLLEGGERISWGAKTIPEGGLLSVPDRLNVPGALLTGDSAGFVNVPKLKGVHYAMRSGMLAAETIYEQLKAGADLASPGALDGYDRRVRQSHIWSDLKKVRNMRQALNRGLYLGGGLASTMDLTRGAFPGGSF